MGLLLLLLLWLCAAQARDSSSLFVKVAHHRSQIRRSFKFPSRAFGERTEDIRLIGNAAVMGDGSIRIPAQDAQANQAGRALFASPVRMWDPNTSIPASFDTTFSFVIQSSSSSTSHETGGGLAFIIAPDEMTVGRDAGYLGMLNDACVHHRRGNSSEGRRPVIAVEFDTFKDDEFGDPNDNHVGLNLGSVISNETADLSNAGVFLRNGSSVTARISYDSSIQHLQVRVSSTHSSRDPEFDPAKQDSLLDDDQVLPLISTPVDLSSFLKEYMFVGFTASTGAEALSHSILSWTFSCASHAVQRFPPVTLSNSKETISHREECEDAIVEDKFDHASGRKGHPPAIFFVFVSVSATVLSLVLIVLVSWRRNRAHSSKSISASISGGGGDPWSMPVVMLPRPRPLHRPREFDLPELVVATGDFAEKQKLGQGPLGVVYRGSLQDGSLVAIKVLSNVWPVSSSGVLCVPSLNMSKNRKRKQQLISEILPAFSKLRHPRLVPVRGWCESGPDLMVVYEYMPNASLDKWLHPAEALLALPWIHRWKLAGDVAAALLHLHMSNFLHGRVKSSNVLMDITFQARLGDFGLLGSSSSRAPSSSDHHPQPEYHLPPEASSSSDPWTREMDVYGFGIVCLELVSGGPPSSEEGGSLVDRAWLLHERGCGIGELVDPKLGGSFVFDQAMTLYGVGLLCSHPDPRSRPAMEGVARLLERRTDIPPIPARTPARCD
ncbi:probable L-type lectin-domain containing receptor kinase S.5 [Selaginella moellendorffii]|uniref:probable L-type lectin-domain containing receptor kinase S.5 n=1 Tax=Selaginella moellendorffii TaxID=88036 RepID=UPI000D1D11E2|nr:probable L-type lectin-domain containing receptor kinase S.5 [Selaginella moellendorffii]XP_024524445.1 probable L-type lectin-domain containing receptor kinase S.5 [Selaginella moellendorffii]XP_024524446.1 probable L-type lectin-domain containing receptor kinase S.5 [Selaginella moellendorffii]|eukprot:XP_024524444.1 probable L-type lectin-domain containing receptor kinase S.5 [Selaginella moellendorffii]